MKPTTPLVALMFAALGAACTQTVDSAEMADDPEATIESADEAAAPERDELPAKKAAKKRGFDAANPRMGAKGGPMMMLMQAVRQLDLSDAQQKELAELKKSFRPEAPEGRGELGQALAKAVESGRVEVAALDAELDAVERRAGERAEAMQTAMQRLHDTLTPEQRSELVKNLEARLEKKDGKRAGKERGHDKGMLAHVARELEPTPEQIEKVRAIEPEPMAEDGPDVRAMLAAFESDSFDAAKAGVGADMPVKARARAERLVKGVAELLPILEPEQRSELAKLLERPFERPANKVGKNKVKRPKGKQNAL